MVEIGENLYIVGGVSSYGSDQKEMHQLSCVSGSCSWTTLIQQLTVARFGLVAIPVDDIFCHSPCQKGDFNPTIFWPYFAIIAFIFMLNLSKWRILSQPAKIGSGKNKLYLSYWAWRSPWGHVLCLITFCQIPVLSWAIRYSVFQKVKLTSSLEFVCDDPFSTFWHLMVKFA